MYSSRGLLKAVRDVAAQLIATSGNAAAAANAGRAVRPGAAAAAAAEADWRGCLRLLAEANRPMIEALQVGVGVGRCWQADALHT
jgi:hypothetical protein